jgi:glutamyl/glutaminyl-tRNA synthetase
LNYIALLGWNPKTTQEFFSMEELIEKFDLKNVHKA